MSIYYIRIDTDRKMVGVRRGNMLDEVNESFLTETYYGLKDRLIKFGELEWPELEKELERVSGFFDKIQSKARFGG